MEIRLGGGIPEDSEEDVDEQISTAAGDEEDTEGWYYFIVSMVLTHCDLQEGCTY